MNLTEKKSDKETIQELEKSMSYMEGFTDGRKCTIVEMKQLLKDTSFFLKACLRTWEKDGEYPETVKEAKRLTSEIRNALEATDE